MKKNIEITGHVKIHTPSRLQIELWIKDEQVDFFTLDLESKTVEIHVEKSTGVLLGMRGVYEGYIKLIADLGLEIPESYKKHWTPTLKESTLWYFIDSKGQVGVNSFSNSTFDNELVANFNIFPNKELAEQATNVSKLERLILLWQYANSCLFEPDWLDDIQCKYFIIYDSRDKNACYDYNFRQKSNKTYFEKREQVKTFIDMYEAEIKELMNIK